MSVEILEVRPDDPRLAPLIRELRAELDARYPEEVDFDHPTVKEAARFLLAVVVGPADPGDAAGSGGAAVGCCAVQPLDRGEAELKRMYVAPRLRGQGLGRRLLTEAERLAVRLGAVRIRLETGPRQPEAIAVYERAGFIRIPNYPPFDQWDLSVCYAKRLTATP